MKIDPNHTGGSIGSNTTSHHNPMLPTSQPSLSIALTRSQFANECGGVLIDPDTQEVCLLFYPDTSEWRLPIGRPDTMSSVHNVTVANFHIPDAAYESPEPSAAGCEPMAHAAQRQISLITGYKCAHIHPAVSSQAIKPEQQCSFTGGPQMVEPLVLHIEQRALPAPLLNISKRVQRSKTLPPTKAAADPAVVAKPKDRKSALMLIPPINSGGDFSSTLEDNQVKEEDTGDKQVEDVEDDNLPLVVPPSTNSQYVMTHYYIAWLTQNRFDSKSGSSLPVSGSKRLPLAEATWFKMDTAAQVLTRDTDKLALREAIQRIALLNKKPFNEPQLPFVCSSAMLDQLAATTKSVTVQISGNAASPDTNGTPSSATESTAGDSGTTQNATPTRIVSPSASRNIDIIRRTATSLSKRGGLLGKVSRASNSDAQVESKKKRKPKRDEELKEEDADSQRRSSTGGMPRMLSIFYKLTGIST